MKTTIRAAAAVVTLIASSAVDAQQAVQWKVSDGGNGHWYRDDLTAVAQTLAARNAAAATIGGHLATVTSQAEHAFVISVAFPGGSLGLNDTWPALGGFRLAGSTQWQWVTGEPFTYAPFSPDPPQYDIAEWLMMWGQGFTPLLWWTGNGNPTLGRAIIEWSADCNSDGVVDYGQILQGQLIDADANGVPDICEVDPCPGDITDGGTVDATDLSIVLAAWGTNGQGEFQADIDGSGLVDGGDLALVLGGWGPCPE
ncbi:MAG: hypothetical protein KGR22_06285 [Planctomycetes bacterium]|nr:hypothetical protein [Planctomycetota bacterium]